MRIPLFILFIYLFQSCITLHVIPSEIGISLDKFLQTKDNHCELKLVEKSNSNTIYSSGFTNDDRVYLYYFNEKNILYKIDKQGNKKQDEKK
jgi:hypothetical protein